MHGLFKLILSILLLGLRGRPVDLVQSSLCLCTYIPSPCWKRVCIFFLLMRQLKWLFSAYCKRSRLLSRLLLTLHVPAGKQFLLIDVSVTQSCKITYGQTLPPEQGVFPLWDGLMWIWQSQISTKSYSSLKPSVCWKIYGSINCVYECKVFAEFLLQ